MKEPYKALKRALQRFIKEQKTSWLVVLFMNTTPRMSILSVENFEE